MRLSEGQGVLENDIECYWVWFSFSGSYLKVASVAECYWVLSFVSACDQW